MNSNKVYFKKHGYGIHFHPVDKKTHEKMKLVHVGNGKMYVPIGHKKKEESEHGGGFGGGLGGGIITPGGGIVTPGSGIKHSKPSAAQRKAIQAALAATFK
jgi:hypothetical protein